jgi:DNA processing protein
MTARPLGQEELCAAGLAALGASPGTLRKFLAAGGAAAAWEAIADGRHPADPERRYRAKADPATLEAVGAACARSAVAVKVLGSPGYPAALASDHQAPAVLFVLGDAGALDGRPRVAVVGTRAATPYGLGVAAELGRDLARSGVVVVSGAALGIDAAAHAGALSTDVPAPTVAILGASVDAPSGRAQCALRSAIASRGALLSEIPPGVHSARWWFAVRNRVMAALAHVVVVVESHHRGGTMNTVAAAAQRGVTVGAVPGSVRSSASAGTNRLLTEGAMPVRDAGDVLTAVELAIAADPLVAPPSPWRGVDPSPAKVPGAPSPALGALPRRVRRALDHDPATLDTVVRRSGLPLGDVSLALEQLTHAGLAVEDAGWWSRPR